MRDMLVEMTVEEAMKICGRNAKVLVAVRDLEKEEQEVLFEQKRREECEKLFSDIKTVVSSVDDLVKRMDCFTEKQDIRSIRPIGLQKIVLVEKWG